MGLELDAEEIYPGTEEVRFKTLKPGLVYASARPFEGSVTPEEEQYVRNVYTNTLAEDSKSTLIIPAWRNQREVVAKRLYDIMVPAAYDAAKSKPQMLVTLFATSEEKEQLLKEAVGRKTEELKKVS